MSIKVGDIVEYNNKQQRVMGFVWGLKHIIRLSHQDKNDHINVNNVTLVESFIKPDIKIGDSVRILKVPDNERKFYMDANKPVDDGIYEVIDMFENHRVGMVVSILVKGEKRHYMAHYVEKIHDYDMI